MVQFQGQYFEVDSGVGWPKNEAWYARCSVIPKPGDGLRLWPMQAGSGTWPSPCGQVYVNSGSFWNHKDLWFVPHFSEPVISLNYEVNMENSVCGGTYSGWCCSSPEEAGHDVTAWFHSASSLWNLVILLAKDTLTKVSLSMCSARQFVVEVDPRGLESGAHYAEVPLPMSDVIMSSSKWQYGVHD